LSGSIKKSRILNNTKNFLQL